MTETRRTDDHLLDAFDDTLTQDVPAAEEPGERDDDLAAALAGAAPRRWWNRGTLVLGGCALLLAGFLGGVLVQQHWGATAVAGNRTAAGANRGAAGEFGGFGGAGRGTGTFGGGQTGGGQTGSGSGTGSAAGAATTGTVKLVDGSTIYVQTANGDVITVRTTPKTTVRTAKTGTIADVKAGQSVTVQGPAGSDGTVAATSVTATVK